MSKGKFHYWRTGDGLTLLEAWARDGLTNEQIAAKVGVSVKTLYEWINRFCEIGDALKKGKEVVDVEVENALLKRAMGYECRETKVKTSDGGEEVTITTKHVPPDVGAIAIWLKNRKPGVWKDKPEDPGDEKAIDAVRELVVSVRKFAEGHKDG